MSDESVKHGGLDGDGARDGLRSSRDRAADAANEDDLIAALRRKAPSPPFEADGTRRRIEATIGGATGDPGSRPHWWGSVLRPVLAIAAGIALFIAGVEYGRSRAARPAQPAPAPEPVPMLVLEAPSLPLTIQSAGSQYIASLARLTEAADRLSPEQRLVAREVALSALLGAALELVREDEGDPTLSRAAALISEKKEGIALDAMPAGNTF